MNDTDMLGARLFVWVDTRPCDGRYEHVITLVTDGTVAVAEIAGMQQITGPVGRNGTVLTVTCNHPLALDGVECNGTAEFDLADARGSLPGWTSSPSLIRELDTNGEPIEA